MGVLSMSRAIGDAHLKRFGVIPTPETTCVDRTPQDEFLLLASDGLWGAMSNEEAVHMARTCICRAQARGVSREAALRVASQLLIKAAMQAGSHDNVTVILMDLTVPQAATSAPHANGAVAARGQGAASSDDEVDSLSIVRARSHSAPLPLLDVGAGCLVGDVLLGQGDSSAVQRHLSIHTPPASAPLSPSSTPAQQRAQRRVPGGDGAAAAHPGCIRSSPPRACTPRSSRSAPSSASPRSAPSVVAPLCGCLQSEHPQRPAGLSHSPPRPQAAVAMLREVPPAPCALTFSRMTATTATRAVGKGSVRAPLLDVSTERLVVAVEPDLNSDGISIGIAHME